MKANRPTLLYLMVVLGLAWVCAACQELKDEDGGSEASSVSVDISVVFPGPENTEVLRNALGTENDIASITVVVQLSADTSAFLPESELTENPFGSGNWEGTLVGIPFDVSLDYIATA
ncbi:MAG: hypothetical protein GY866_41865 [Proteobacteria bacterium]|nr:hypothetical protein [Pseudomonadota bacterium]